MISGERGEGGIRGYLALSTRYSPDLQWVKLLAPTRLFIKHRNAKLYRLLTLQSIHIFILLIIQSKLVFELITRRMSSGMAPHCSTKTTFTSAKNTETCLFVLDISKNTPKMNERNK